MQQIKIYVAAKKKHSEKLLEFFRKQEGIHLCARWLETANLDVNKNKPAPHWQQENFDDIVASHFVVMYAEPGDRMVIAIGEAFYGMAFGRMIYVVGHQLLDGDEVRYHPDYEDWTSNPARVRRVPTLTEAVREIKARVAREGTK